jgi:hypothetical protein
MIFFFHICIILACSNYLPVFVSFSIKFIVRTAARIPYSTRKTFSFCRLITSPGMYTSSWMCWRHLWISPALMSRLAEGHCVCSRHECIYTYPCMGIHSSRMHFLPWKLSSALSCDSFWSLIQWHTYPTNPNCCLIVHERALNVNPAQLSAA